MGCDPGGHVELTVRTMKSGHLEAAQELWRRTEHMGIGGADELSELQKFLRKNPGLSRVVTASEGGTDRLVGTVLTGYDGRRAYLYHLAVDRAYRGRGIARSLLDAVVDKLAELRVERCHIMIFAENTPGIAAWRRLGWADRPDISVMSRDIVSPDTELRC